MALGSRVVLKDCFFEGREGRVQKVPSGREKDWAWVKAGGDPQDPERCLDKYHVHIDAKPNSKRLSEWSGVVTFLTRKNLQKIE